MYICIYILMYIDKYIHVYINVDSTCNSVFLDSSRPIHLHLSNVAPPSMISANLLVSCICCVALTSEKTQTFHRFSHKK